MKKTVICSITMQENAVPIAHAGEDRSIPASLAPTVYPVVDYLAQTMQDETDVHFILLRKQDPDGRYEKNTDILRAEFAQRCGGKCANAEWTIIDSPFSEDIQSHAQVIRQLCDSIEAGSEITADVTYGSKDLPILFFSAAAFAVRHMNCRVDRILYRQAHFVDHRPVDAALCDLSPLLDLTALIYTMNCGSPDDAKKMLRTLLAF